VSNVETANTPTPALAIGVVSEASTPTRVNGIAPAARRHRHPCSQCVPSGTCSCRHTTDNSSAVRVTLNTSPAVAQAGTADPNGNLHTANRPATSCSVSERAGEPTFDPAVTDPVENVTGLAAAR
jgi:hypothetical protein